MATFPFSSSVHPFRSLQNEISAKQSISEELTKVKAQHLEAEKASASNLKQLNDLNLQLDQSRNENKKLIAKYVESIRYPLREGRVRSFECRGSNAAF